ncbi:MAG: hypothetical protein AAGI22_13195 [Planctomycetota bacterium]
MIPALLHSAVLAASGAPQVPVAQEIPPAIAQTRVPACVQLTETHFVADSFVDEMLWLVFANAHGLRRVRGLAPHGRTLLPIVDGAASGMSVEVVTRDLDGSFLTSGALDCATLTGDAVFLSRSETGLVGWIPRHGGRSLTRAQTGASVLPAARLAHARPATAAATHVPVPTPAENRKRDKSRRLKRKKLPPI